MTKAAEDRPGEITLESIRSPEDLKDLSVEQLTALAEEIRRLIAETVSRRGGHLASNLGVIELTLALHAVFDFRRDRLLWDVGHQCYAHKIVTGRREAFDRLRQRDGVSGFPAPSESEYDLFATGHAGTAIATAAGMAWADAAAGRGDRKVVAVVGDASIVNGLSLEAINNAGMLRRQFLVILNDNSMAIDVTQGRLATLLDRIRLTRTYSDMKQRTERVLRSLPLGEEVSDALRHIKEGLRTTVYGERFFEGLGFRYFGPMDGHDIGALRRILRLLSQVEEPVLLHVHTQKGRGCDYAVEDPCRFHSPSAHTVNGNVVEFPAPGGPSWTQVFSGALLQRARRDKRIIALTAAMPDGTGLDAFRDTLPDRYMDVGINESCAVAMAAGMAKAGLRPVVAIYSTFCQRAFDQLFEEISLQDLPVLLCMDRAGLVGSDGAVHHGMLDLAYLRPLPGMVLMAPADATELEAMLDLALSLDRPCAIRYPRDEAPQTLPGEAGPVELGKAHCLRQGADGSFLALGAMAEYALTAAEALRKEKDIDVAVYSARFVKPLDEALIAGLIESATPVLTVEDHAAAGGFGSAVMELAAARGLDARNVRILGLPDRFIAHASRSEQLAEAGLDAKSLAAAMAKVTSAGHSSTVTRHS
ncbi:MAG TPA: 1-deoxy-D-xylulose-5-phosphate synthase [Phycisphaerae bacterium]|nr:1-deoxy-D-xylulose-5-phosphate synthase [Phycisphaerae bacterium]